MFQIILLMIISISFVYGLIIPPAGFVGGAVVPNDKDYYIYKQDNIEIIHTKENSNFAKHTAKLEPSIHDYYEKFYSWKLDEILYVGLISQNNQIANGFSTQFPNNRQINYVGGTQLIDYFTTTSWLDTLLYHETAHNYQINVKDSLLSRSLHSVFGNGSFFIPSLTLPNLTENSFMLEGNAVLNESWHGNGGRLYSGRLYAQTLLQAKSNKIKAGEVYNAKLEFPYGEIFYIQGGFYNLYMAQHYGLKSINSYFKHHSEDWYWPFFTNASMEQATGTNFEDSLECFADEYAQRADSLVLAKGEKIASSQFFTQLNSDEKEIFFLTNESGRRAPELVRINKKNKKISKQRKSFSASKLIKVDDEFYTQSSANTSPTKIMQGLYDSKRFIKEGSASKMVQGYLSDGKEVYFDVPFSYSEAQLYVGNKFYAQVNSSVFIDKKDNLYYFVQKNKKRILYRNKTPLMHLNAYYGFVNDIDSKGGIYFIANTKYGSSLFRLKNSIVSRVSAADNIVEARLINDKEVLIAAVGEEEYYYVTTKLVNIDASPYELRHFFEDKEYFAKTKEQKMLKQADLKEEFNSFTNMKYNGLDLAYGIGTNGNNVGIFNLRFADPLGQNALNAYLSTDEQNVTIAGMGYISALTLLNYGVYAYGVIEGSLRDKGIIAFADLALYQAGYDKFTLGSSYYQDYQTGSREPLSINARFSHYEQFGVSKYANYFNALSIYATQDRGDAIYGFEYNFIHDLPAEFYLSLDIKSSYSPTQILSSLAQDENRGVKMSTSSFANNKDVSVIGMRSIRSQYYVKNASYVDVGLKKVFNFSSYWFTFPLSLQREVMRFNYKYFDIKTFSNTPYSVSELRAGLTFDLVVFNKAVIPTYVEYIYNDSVFASEKGSVLYGFSLSF